MATTPQQTRPGKLWYGWQRAHAFLHSLKNASTQKVAKAAAIKSSSGLGVAIAGYAVGAVAKAMLIPILPLVALGGYIVGGIMLMSAYHDFAYINRSSFVKSFIYDKETAWKKNVGGPSLWARVKSSVTNFRKKMVGGVVSRIAAVLKIASFGLAAVSATAATFMGLYQASALPAVLHYPVSNGLLAATNLLSLSSLATTALSITIGAASVALLGLAIGLKCRQIQKQYTTAPKAPTSAPETTTTPRVTLNDLIPIEDLSIPEKTAVASPSVKAPATPKPAPRANPVQDAAAAARAKARADAKKRGMGGF